MFEHANSRGYRKLQVPQIPGPDFHIFACFMTTVTLKLQVPLLLRFMSMLKEYQT